MERHHAALCRHYIDARVETDPEWAMSPSIKPLYASVAEREIHKHIAGLQRNLGRAMRAARMAIPFLQQAAGYTVRLPKEMSRLSINAAAQWITEDAGISDPQNVRKLVWKECRPIVHIATAIAEVIEDVDTLRSEKEALGELAPSPLSFAHFFMYPDLIRRVANLSETHAQLMRDSKLPKRLAEGRLRLALA